MNVKELKTMLNECKDEQEVILKSDSGIEWQIKNDLHNLHASSKYKKKATMHLNVV